MVYMLLCVLSFSIWRIDSTPVQCLDSTSSALQVQVPASEEADMYQVRLSINNSRPVVVHTSNSTQFLITHLIQSTVYQLSYAYHKGAAPSIVAGWEYFDSEKTPCATKPSSHVMHRTNQASSSKLDLTLKSTSDNKTLSSSSHCIVSLIYIGHKDAAIASDIFFKPSHLFHPSSTQTIAHTCTASFLFTSLTSSSHYMAVSGVDCSASTNSMSSIASCSSSSREVFATSSPGARYKELFRVSEYTFEVDFLPNHNSATRDAMGPYLMHGTPLTTQTNWPNTTADDWNTCQDVMQSLCPEERLSGLACMSCAEANRDQVGAYYDYIACMQACLTSPQITPACGNFTYHDNANEGYPVHFYCGIGWPESVIMNSSITRYCLEYIPAQADDVNDGFAQYVSCNSDETDYYGNRPYDPLCMCWVYDDRILSQQTSTQLDKDCSYDKEPYVNERICSCGGLGPIPEPSSLSSRFVGKSDVFLPYGFYLDKPPPSSYNVSIPAGENLSTPKAGQCRHGASIGTHGCTWKRESAMQVLYGADLFEAGWNPAQVQDTPTNVSVTEYNMRVFEKAANALGRYSQIKCCGC